MSLASYSRAKFFWGAIDITHSDEAAYSPAQSHSMGTTAVPPGIGVRRCSLRFTRLGMAPAEDVISTYLDFQNFTSGNPDDSWIDADFSTLETAMDSFWNAIKAYAHNKVILAEYRWYRVGPGVLPPNPPARITTRSIAGTSGGAVAPQVAVSLTKKTAARRQWGRMYLPLNGSITSDTTGRIGSACLGAVSTAADALMSTSSAADFMPVVYSPTRSKAYSIEHFQVDDLFDVIRSRRYDKPITRLITP